MAGISALGTTYNLPNYTGVLFGLTPADTPFFSAIGGLTGGMQTTSTEFEWQTYDLRDASQPAILEGADAPALTGRARANVTNVCQIHHSALGVSYTKLAAVGQHNGANIEATNPVRAELDWQVAQELKAMARDINFSFLQGTYQKPSDNSTARKTRGLLAAITTNVVTAETLVGDGGSTWADVGELITEANHGLVVGDRVRIAITSGATGATSGFYYVKTVPSSSTFTVSATKGGAVQAVTADGTADVFKQNPVSVAKLGDLLQSVYDNGGISEQGTATVIVNSAAKRQITTAYGELFGKFMETSRTVGGVAVDTIVTDFGVLNVMLDRHMPQGTLAVASLEQCSPVFLEVPSKGHFFAEPLAKTGATDRAQIYGEVGLAYGSEKAHGKLTGLFF
ncbi:MAG TPA: DUF5309 family protein [Mycobacteriales bacterium]